MCDQQEAATSLVLRHASQGSGISPWYQGCHWVWKSPKHQLWLYLTVLNKLDQWPKVTRKGQAWAEDPGYHTVRECTSDVLRWIWSLCVQQSLGRFAHNVFRWKLCCNVMGMLPGPAQPRAHLYEKREKPRKQSVWVTHTRPWHKAVLSLQTLALHQHLHSPVFCIKILWSPMLHALGSKWLHRLQEEEWEARIDYPRLASYISASLSFDRYHYQFVLLPSMFEL